TEVVPFPFSISRRCRYSFAHPYPRFLPERRVLFNPVADMKDELCCCSRDTFAVWYVIERTLQLRMLVNVFANFHHALAGGLQALLELGLGFDLGFAERHLHTAVCVDFAFARSFNRQEDHVFEFVDYCRLRAV